MTERVAIYGRFSDDRQNPHSASDQIAVCTRTAHERGWDIIETYTDEAISGSVRNRPGYQKLRHAIVDGTITVIMAEALDRLSRSQEETANLFNLCRFHDIKIYTLSENWISELHVGLSSTMNALYLRHLADKTKRGLEQRVERGQSAGGLSYGYRVPTLPTGLPDTGKLEIVPEQADVIRRIYTDYARGVSPRAIAAALNAEHIPAPQHGKRRGDGNWRANAIQGNRQRGTGILNNELYGGIRVWNRLRYVRPPGEARRVSRPNPESEWKRDAVPHLRIIDQALWDRVRARQTQIDETRAAKDTGDTQHLSGSHATRRPVYLLSGLIRCGACGGTMNIAGSNPKRYYCADAREKGRFVCQGIPGIAQHKLESTVLDGLRHELMQPAAVADFITRYQAYQRDLDRNRQDALARLRRESGQVQRKIDNVMEAIMRGILTDSTKATLEQLESRKKALTVELAQTTTQAPSLPADLAAVYAAKVTALVTSLNDPATRLEATEAVRGLIDRIIVVWDADLREHRVKIEGKLVALLRAGQTTKPASDQNGRAVRTAAESSLELVAGAGFEPAAFRL
ncbi:recombinase family protein [Asaia siamensis]|uniref:Resolvase n=1 Tax=Asaia siamensis TaxID=110479 RepID=A0ABQ1MKL8_9PROT|nr:recombinase family protein [Asaia siamensis]GBR07131.1 putative recombinase [Asaia siamensis NRIC 0323]GGC42075.1 resolvase [Asaia siamensis]